MADNSQDNCVLKFFAINFKRTLSFIVNSNQKLKELNLKTSSLPGYSWDFGCNYKEEKFIGTLESLLGGLISCC